MSAGGIHREDRDIQRTGAPSLRTKAPTSTLTRTIGLPESGSANGVTASDNGTSSRGIRPVRVFSSGADFVAAASSVALMGPAVRPHQPLCRDVGTLATHLDLEAAHTVRPCRGTALDADQVVGAALVENLRNDLFGAVPSDHDPAASALGQDAEVLATATGAAATGRASSTGVNALIGVSTPSSMHGEVRGAQSVHRLPLVVKHDAQLHQFDAGAELRATLLHVHRGRPHTT